MSPVWFIEPDPPEEPPSDGDLLMVLSDHFDADPNEVLRWLGDFNAETALFQYRSLLGLTK